MCDHGWLETIVYNYTGKTFARCLECDEKKPSIVWYEFNIMHKTINEWYLKYVKSGVVELPLTAFIELENIIRGSASTIQSSSSKEKENVS